MDEDLKELETLLRSAYSLSLDLRYDLSSPNETAVLTAIGELLKSCLALLEHIPNDE